MEETTKNKKPIYKKWWFWVLAVIVIGGIASMSKDKNSTAGSSSAPTYDAASIYSEYEANEVSADNKYKDKEFNVTGTVRSVGKDILNHAYVTLETSNIVGSVQCFVEDENALASIQKGASIKLYGTGGGKLGNVFVNHSKIIK